MITKFVDCKSKKELLSGLQHIGYTNFHLKMIGLDSDRGTLFFLPYTGKVGRNKVIFF